MRRGLRARLTLFTVLGAAITLTALTVGFNLSLSASLDADANRLLAARTQATLQSLRIDAGKVRIAETPETVPDARAWVFVGDKTLERPAAPRSLDLLARSLAAGPTSRAEDGSTDTRLYAAPIKGEGIRLGTVVSGISLEPYERSAKRALIGSVIFAAIVLALISIASRVVISRALRPVARMTAEATDWSEHDLDHRFNAGEPHDELTRLAAAFDGMLDRLAAALRHEQRFSAEVSHELRTPLAAIVTEAELALRRERTNPEYRESLQRITGRSQQLQEVLETLLLAAREEAEPGVGAELRPAAERAVASFAALAAEQGVTIDPIRGDERLLVDAGPATVERILAPLIENACRYGCSRVGVELTRSDGVALITVADDGPGVEPGETELIFEPGARGAAGAQLDPRSGTGLGLALARRLARAVGGDVRVNSNGGGAAFEVSLPTSSRRAPAD